MTRTSVSIITPSYNQSEFIGETIESVLAQNYSHVEHFVADGGSTDGTLEILENYDNKIEWISEDDRGQADAINKGFNRVSGDIIGWLNSDDVYFDVNVLDRVVDYFENTGADVIYGDMALINSDSKIMKFSVLPDFDYEHLLRSCFIVQPSLFFKRNVVEENKLDINLEFVMDYEYWLRLADKYDFYHVSDVLSADRNHGGRKILDQRDNMKEEGRSMRRDQYGIEFDPMFKMRRFGDLLFSGVQRSMIGAKRAYEYHNDPPKLAFPGEFKPLLQLIINSFRPNRKLV